MDSEIHPTCAPTVHLKCTDPSPHTNPIQSIELIHSILFLPLLCPQPSCSLQFLPFSVRQEASLLQSHKPLAPTLSFALEKLRDLQDLASAMGDDDTSRELEDAWVRTRYVECPIDLGEGSRRIGCHGR